MSTRGLYGIRKNGIDKCTYNHSDSYPSWLGERVLSFCKNNTIEKLENFFEQIIMITEDDTPTEEQIQFCKDNGFVDFSVSNGSEQDWYCLLRNLQGNFEIYQQCIDEQLKVFMTDGIDFIKESLFCEHAYIINLDTKMLEYYKGFQKVPQKNNRYGIDKSGNYYPCKLMVEIPLNEIKDISYWLNIMNYGSKLSKDEIKELTDCGITIINGIYENHVDVAKDHLDNYYYNVPDYIKEHIDMESLGKDITNDEEWKILKTGRIVHLY